MSLKPEQISQMRFLQNPSGIAMLSATGDFDIDFLTEQVGLSKNLTILKCLCPVLRSNAAGCCECF